ncbi:MAG: hypothetical protein AAF959_10915 [Cyanobacteria bacterium P01_D01_bin.56]
MRYWEFLIQQEGDQTWLPLETRQVEILEGRYRMAAHTSYDDTSVEVRVSQLLLDEMPPRRRVRKRKSITNDSGLLAIFPFIQLSPGHWEIHCNSPDVIDDFLGESWHYSVQLQVTPREDEDWDPDWAGAEPDIAQSALDIDHESLPTESATTEDNDLQLRLQLKQQAYVTQPGQSLTLSGELALAQTVSVPFHGQLWLELRDPQSASTLQEMAFDVSKPFLPSPFSVTIAVPQDLSTQVILGAISLRNESGETLNSASFTVTVGLAQMLDAIANQPDLEFEEEISIFPGTTESLVPSLEKSATLLDNDTPLIPKEIVPSEGLTLPPQLKPPSHSEIEEERQLEPELPEFSRSAEPVLADDNDKGTEDAQAEDNRLEPPEESPQPAEPREQILVEIDRLLADESRQPVEAAMPQELPRVETDAEDDITEATQEDDESLPREQIHQSRPFAEPRVFERGSLQEDDLDRELVNAALNEQPYEQPFDKTLFSQVNDTFEKDFTEPTPAPPDPVDEIDLAFQRLRLQERFWEKLNVFTQDGYRQSLEVKKALDVADIVSPGNPNSNEFVVYDTPAQPTRFTESAPTASKVDDEPIEVPAPALDIPEEELVTGEWVAVRVRVPARPGQVYVKVWMNDLQTRTLVDAPRLLMQLTPNDYNELETLMRVKIPTGCLELQFAAISIDMATLQESRKVVQNRRVMPPDDSLSIFDDLNL